MHRLAHVLRAAESEGEVRDAAGDARARAALLDQPRRVDERACVLGMLLDPRADRENVRVEDQVLGREAGALCEQAIGPLADLDLALDGVGLALLVERHDDEAGAVAPHAARLLEEAPPRPP